MKVVAENSSAELAQRLATQDMERALRQLTANLLRVVRGAGKPYAIVEDAAAFINAVVAYHDAAGTALPPDDIASALDIMRDDPGMRSRLSGHDYDRMDAERIIVRGALQIAASRLLEQRTQEAAGKHELYDGVRWMEKLRDTLRKEHRLAARVQAGSKPRHPG